MKLSEVAIQRPVLASMASAALVLFGVIGYSRLSVREFPDVDPPIISVSTNLPGAHAQVVETAVTDILEEELSTIQGLRTLTSNSQEEFSQITLEFNLDRPVDVAAQDVRDKVSRVRRAATRDQELHGRPFDSRPLALSRVAAHRVSTMPATPCASSSKSDQVAALNEDRSGYLDRGRNPRLVVYDETEVTVRADQGVENVVASRRGNLEALYSNRLNPMDARLSRRCAL